MDRQLTIWIAVTSSAVILQALIMLAMYLAMRKTSAKVEGLAEEVKNMQAERKQVRSRIEKLLGQIDQLGAS